MKKYLIDANLPSKIKVWQLIEFEFVSKIDDEWSDGESSVLRHQKLFTLKSGI